MDNTEHIIQELRSEKWEMAQEIERLREALKEIEYLDRPQIRGLPRRVTIQEIALAALQQKETE